MYYTNFSKSICIGEIGTRGLSRPNCPNTYSLTITEIIRTSLLHYYSTKKKLLSRTLDNTFANRYNSDVCLNVLFRVRWYCNNGEF